MIDTPFLRFWRAINQVRAALGRPEMLFGEANRCWRSAAGF